MSIGDHTLSCSLSIVLPPGTVLVHGLPGLLLPGSHSQPFLLGTPVPLQGGWYLEADIQLLYVLTALGLWPLGSLSGQRQNTDVSHAYFCLTVYITNHELTPVPVSPLPRQPA